jgi:hypothetical protein
MWSTDDSGLIACILTMVSALIGSGDFTMQDIQALRHFDVPL